MDSEESYYIHLFFNRTFFNFFSEENPKSTYLAFFREVLIQFFEKFCFGLF